MTAKNPVRRRQTVNYVQNYFLHFLNQTNCWLFRVSSFTHFTILRLTYFGKGQISIIAHAAHRTMR